MARRRPAVLGRARARWFRGPSERWRRAAAVSAACGPEVGSPATARPRTLGPLAPGSGPRRAPQRVPCSTRPSRPSSATPLAARGPRPPLPVSGPSASLVRGETVAATTCGVRVGRGLCPDPRRVLCPAGSPTCHPGPSLLGRRLPLLSRE